MFDSSAVTISDCHCRYDEACCGRSRSQRNVSCNNINSHKCVDILSSQIQQEVKRDTVTLPVLNFLQYYHRRIFIITALVNTTYHSSPKHYIKCSNVCNQRLSLCANCKLPRSQLTRST